MRKINIVLFSSGVSEKNGILDAVIEGLKNKGYNVFCWRDIFSKANNTNQIALLPILIKKIPTFDFAILIGEGHDNTTILRNNKKIRVKTMRDNVLFEIGLSAMALGLNRVILLSDGDVHLPDDLTGIHGELAIKNISWHTHNLVEAIDSHIKKNRNNYYLNEEIFADIDGYITKMHRTISPVVIGAATSTAIGYTTNFIIRLLENIDKGFYCDGKLIKTDIKKIKLHVVIPEDYAENLTERADLKANKLLKATVKNTRHRDLNFNYRNLNNNIHIYDYPTSLVTSYDTAKMILDLDADEEDDKTAKIRFYQKELDLFEATLKNILNPIFIRDRIEKFYPNLSPKRKDQMFDNIMYVITHNFIIERKNY